MILSITNISAYKWFAQLDGVTRVEEYMYSCDVTTRVKRFLKIESKNALFGAADKE